MCRLKLYAFLEIISSSTNRNLIQTFAWQWHCIRKFHHCCIAIDCIYSCLLRVHHRTWLFYSLHLSIWSTASDSNELSTVWGGKASVTSYWRSLQVSINMDSADRHLPPTSFSLHEELKPNSLWKCLRDITSEYYCSVNSHMSQWKWIRGDEGTFPRVTALAIAAGSVVAFNPGWVTGVCWCAEEGQEGTLLPRPLRNHAGNSWAKKSDSRVRGNVAGSVGLPLGEQALSYTMGSDMNHDHVRMYARVYTFVRLHRGIGRARRSMAQDDVFGQTTPARQKLSTEAKVWSDCGQVCVSPRTVMLLCQTMCECYLPS